jgi:hypothetical protein
MAYMAQDKNSELMGRQYKQTGAYLARADAQILRRAELTLRNWAERACGWNTDHASVVLSRDEDTGIPYHEVNGFRGTSYRARVNDLETGALRRVSEVCERNGLDFYHQPDPRGCSLYISKAGAGMDDTNYSRFIACSVTRGDMARYAYTRSFGYNMPLDVRYGIS